MQQRSETPNSGSLLVALRSWLLAKSEEQKAKSKEAAGIWDFLLSDGRP
jgi:hypothetical protein